MLNICPARNKFIECKIIKVDPKEDFKYFSDESSQMCTALWQATEVHLLQLQNLIPTLSTALSHSLCCAANKLMHYREERFKNWKHYEFTFCLRHVYLMLY